jgi:hypothetical protein
MADITRNPNAGPLAAADLDRDEDEAIARADYESWAGPWWFRLVDRHPLLMAVSAFALGAVPVFWS